MDIWKATREKLANFYTQPGAMAEQTHNPNPPVSEEVSAAQKQKDEDEAVAKVEAMLNKKQERRRII